MKKIFSIFAATLFAVAMNAAAITVAEALQIAGALEQGATTDAEYEIEGYVTGYAGNDADGGWATYGNQMFWIADAKGSTAVTNEAGALEVYQGVPTEKVFVGDKVSVKGKLTNYNGLLETAKRAPVTILEKVERPEGEDEDQPDVVFTSAEFNGQGTSGTGGTVTATKDGVTFTCDKGFGDQYGVRCYKNSVVTITSTGEQIGKIVFDFATVSGKTYDGGGMNPTVVVNGQEWSATMADQARMNKISIFFGTAEEEPAEELTPITAAEALEKCQALEVGATEKVAVLCYVASIKTPYDSQYGNVTVWLNDDPTSTYGNIQAYRAKCSAEDGAALKEHDKVLVVGNLSHTTYEKDGETKHSYQIAQGAQLTIKNETGVENIVLGEQAKKVMMEGQVYIIRDNKLFNLQGVQVR